MHAHASPLMVDMVRAGKIPGLTMCDLIAMAREQAATGRVQPIPVRLYLIKCEFTRAFPREWAPDSECGMPIRRNLYVANPVTDPTLLCQFHAILADLRGAQIHTLIGDDLW